MTAPIIHGGRLSIIPKWSQPEMTPDRGPAVAQHGISSKVVTSIQSILRERGSIMCRGWVHAWGDLLIILRIVQLWRRILHWLIRWIYFDRIRLIHPERLPDLECGPILFVSLPRLPGGFRPRAPWHLPIPETRRHHSQRTVCAALRCGHSPLSSPSPRPKLS